MQFSAVSGSGREFGPHDAAAATHAGWDQQNGRAVEYTHNFEINSLEMLQQWHQADRPVVPGSRYAGCKHEHQNQDIKHPNDVLGLVAGPGPPGVFKRP